MLSSRYRNFPYGPCPYTYCANILIENLINILNYIFIVIVNLINIFNYQFGIDNSDVEYAK